MVNEEIKQEMKKGIFSPFLNGGKVMVPYIDSHCHLTCDECYENVDELIKQAKAANVSKMMIICTNIEEFEKALPIRQKDPDTFKIAFGWYPEDALKVTKEDMEYLENAAKNHQIDVLGEIGLDYHNDKSYKDKQIQLFKDQIAIANKYNLPIAIHMREASGDCMDILKSDPKTRIIFHCYSGSAETLKEALKLNSLISFAGPITFKNNKQGPENVKICPVDRILSETDSPYLAPVPKRGKRNQPAFVQYTVGKIAEIKEMDEEELKEQIEKNFDSLFATDQIQ